MITRQPNISCTRRVQFCAGHRVFQHESKCAHPHGHNYVAYFQAEAAKLDDVGRVIDFSVLKEKLGGWIEANWDHGFVYFVGDQQMRNVFELVKAPPAWKHFALPSNPTAENMAEYLLYIVSPRELQGTGIEIVKVTLYETENCFATAEVGP